MSPLDTQTNGIATTPVALNAFVSMPYDSDDEPKKYWSAFYKKAILPAKEILECKTPFRLRFVYPKRGRSPGEIPKLVGESLDSAHVLVCVLTEFRPNVMYEVGYARRMGIPIVFLLERGHQHGSTPILIGRPQTCYYDGHDEAAFETIPGDLWEFLLGACYEAQAKFWQQPHVTQPIFTTRCYQNRDHLDIPGLIRQTKSEIEILTTNMDYFVAPPRQALQHPFRIAGLKTAVRRGVVVRIWTMDPDSNIVVQRAKLLEPAIIQKRDVFQYRKALIKNIKTLYVAFAQEIAAGKFSIGIYDALPTLMIYRFDCRYFIPSVSLIKRSRDCIHVEFQETDPGVGYTFQTALDEIRKIAEPVQHYSWIDEDWPEPYAVDLQGAEEPGPVNRPEPN